MGEGGLGEIAGGILGEIGSTFLQDRLNTRGANAQRDWEGGMYARRYQTQVKDLLAAGLNPMLAYSQTPGGVPTSGAVAVNKPDISSAFNTTRATSAQVANVNQDTMKKAAETRNTDIDTLVKSGMVEEVAARTAAALSSAEQSRAMVNQIEATIPKIEAEIKNIETQIEKNKSDIRLNESLIVANKYLNSLRSAETYLKQQETLFNQPKEQAYKADSKGKRSNILGQSTIAGDLMQQFYRMINPFKGGK